MATASAVTNWYDNIGVITRFGSGADLIDKEIDLIVNRKNNIPIQGGRLFRKESVETLVHKESTVGNEMPQPRKQEDTDAVVYGTPPPGFDKSMTAEMYRMGVAVTRTLTVAQRHQKIKFMMSGLMDAAKRNLEYAWADAGLNNAFATNIGADGMYLCDTGHPNEDVMTGTWDNLETAADLTHAGFSTARVNMRKRTNALGEVMPMKPDQLIVAPDFEEIGWQIINSPDVSDSALRGKSWNHDSVELFVYDYLSDVDSWFLADTGNIATNGGLVYVEKEAPTIRPNPSPQADVIFDEYLRMFYVAAFVSGREFQGNAGL